MNAIYLVPGPRHLNISFRNKCSKSPILDALTFTESLSRAHKLPVDQLWPHVYFTDPLMP